jgi:hypothetical protein
VSRLAVSGSTARREGETNEAPFERFPLHAVTPTSILL